MWFFSKKESIADSCLLEGFTDWHSHLLPGVDDGVRTLQESIEILDLLECHGVSSVWCTPHIMGEIPNTTDYLKKKFSEFRCAYRGRISLGLSAEYMLDNLFEERFKAGDLLPLDTDALLIETSYIAPPYAMGDRLRAIRRGGYDAILAHPERYRYMDMADYYRLKDDNILLQLNLGALTGVYGALSQTKSEVLLKKGLYDLCGMDIHSKRFLLHLLGSRLSSSVIDRLRILLRKNHLK